MELRRVVEREKLVEPTRLFIVFMEKWQLIAAMLNHSELKPFR